MPDPIANARVLDVLELGADRFGVDAFEEGDHFAQRHLAALEEEFGGDDETEVLLAETQLAQTEQRILRPLIRQRAIVWPSVR